MIASCMKITAKDQTTEENSREVDEREVLYQGTCQGSALKIPTY